MKGWLEVANANRYNQMYIKGFLDLSGDLNVRNHNFYLQRGDASLGGNLYVSKTSFLQNTVCLGDLSINGNLNVNFTPNSIPPSAIQGGVAASTGIFSMDISANAGLSVQKNTTLHGNLTTIGKTVFQNDASFQGNVYTNNLFINGVALSNNYALLSGATFSGPLTIPTATIQTLKLGGDLSANGNLFAKGSLYENSTLLSTLYAKLQSPVFTGSPTAPTPDASSSNTQIATTAFVQNQLTGYVSKQSAAFLSSMSTPNLYVTNDASFNARIFVGGDASMNGNLHLGKFLLVDQDASLRGRLLVQGDVSINGHLAVQNDVSFQHKLAVASDTSLNGELSIGGNATVQNNIILGGSMIAQNNMNIYGIINQYSTTLANGSVVHTADITNSYSSGGGAGSSNGFFTTDISTNGNVFATTFYENKVPLSTTYAKIANPTFQGTVSLPQNVKASGDISANGNLFAGLAIYEGGTPLSSKYATLANPTFTGIPNAPNPAASSSNTQIATTYFVKSQMAGFVTLYSPSFLGSVTTPYLYATNDASLNAKLYVGGDVSMNGNIRVGKAAAFNGDVTLNSRLFAKGDASLNGNVSVGKTLSVAGNTTLSALTTTNLLTAQNGLTVTAGNTSVVGLIASSKINAQNGFVVTNGDVSMNSRFYVAGDTSMNSNLDVSGSILTRHNMNIYGVINQYTASLDNGYLVNSAGSNTGIWVGNSTNGQNTVVGSSAATNVTSGSNNTVLGYGAGASITTGSNNIVVGANASSSTGTVSNEITLGNGATTTLRCQAATITSLSDSRDKTNISPLTVGMDFLQKLKPVSFTWNMRDGSRIGDADFGFLAQDLQQAQTDSGVPVPNLVYDINPDRLEASYGALIPILVKAIQDLQAQVMQQQAEINALKNKLP